MASQYINLPAPAGNSAGAAVDVSSFGAVKTIVMQGVWSPPNKLPTVNIEMNNDSVPNGSWAPVCTFRGTGIITVQNAARWMRARVSGYTGGQAPDVNMGGTDEGALFEALAVPSGNGVGAASDVSALGLLKTLQIGNRYSGSIILELSEDAGGAEWAEWQSFQAPGQASNVAAANWARIKRVGVPSNDPYGVPLVTLGGTDLAGGGGGGGSGDIALARVLNSEGAAFQSNFGFSTVTLISPGIFELVLASPLAVVNDAIVTVTPRMQSPNLFQSADWVDASTLRVYFAQADGTPSSISFFVRVALVPS